MAMFNEIIILNVCFSKTAFCRDLFAGMQVLYLVLKNIMLKL